ncbi:hypothetical protein [Streptomyces hydrogenans]|uniref:Uncharacterized protein n=1 Tax=Streptomyces hydrogenans TaxID=1873719 RepID=A0ABQ3PEF0_9ACTN|nr:hypothetical protein [Streptomyces hydrogenans]GHG19711.1 hypothetical protein GCM10018784_36140 [Streptomyces hydrogenans]GHI20392.1 hypothetical protein Shyd_17630 [Streptomyces hydrogenans]GHI20403.1 hypothetical protein Shyd_17740 [Streptomyces hydrogenans]GHI22789.1 hypothetical protein Shyd_41600 [Streptomyces hydrogenans]GHI22807.1 hypothetical protein Shyd_41780 [Streptomyces hydrogenans]
MSFSFTNPQPDRSGRSFSFTDPQPEDDGRSFSFTGPDPADIDRQLQTITDMATEILRLVADVRRQINT